MRLNVRGMCKGFQALFAPRRSNMRASVNKAYDIKRAQQHFLQRKGSRHALAHHDDRARRVADVTPR